MFIEKFEHHMEIIHVDYNDNNFVMNSMDQMSEFLNDRVKIEIMKKLT